MFELRSERLKRLDNPNVYDLYHYDSVSEKFRNQIIHLFFRIENIFHSLGGYNFFEEIEEIFSEEKGVLSMGNSTHKANVCKYIVSCSVYDLLDLIEISIKYLKLRLDQHDKNFNDQHIESIINHVTTLLNQRFKTNNLGYEFISYEIIKKDTQYIHEEIVKPALKLIHDENFKGVEEEFLEAHNKFINDEFKDTVAESNKAFESTMKTICERKAYAYNKDKDTAAKLINILLEENFIPEYLSTHFTGLRTTLQAGLPTLRNREGGHGQGDVPIEVPESYAKYALNLTATNISFLINLYVESKE